MKSYKEAADEMDRKVIDAFNYKMQGDYDSALSIISDILVHETYTDLRCDAYGYRAAFLEQLGRLDEAIEDWLSSYSLITPNPLRDVIFKRYVTELRIGGVCEKQSKNQAATEWYKKALTTICEGEGTSGGSALKSFINIVGEKNLKDNEKALCNEVVLKSWELMHTLGRLEGEPNLTNLMETAEVIIKAESKPRPSD
ncbi:hypothetical protein ACFLZI_03540 [Nitrospirota bacterium]